MQFDGGRFVVSLDFELMWGVFDKRTIHDYGKNIIAVWDVIPRTLALFDQHGICATFATVGFLYADGKTELQTMLPDLKPEYTEKQLSPYTSYIPAIANNGEEDQYHFAKPLIQLIKGYPAQEIGTHTFSHYFCLEGGQEPAAFKADLSAAIALAAANGIKTTSIVFPRNQINPEHLEICRESGIKAYRGNERHWIYKAERLERKSDIKRGLRLLDTYINLSGHHCYPLNYPENKVPVEFPIDIPSSRFLRPYSPKLKVFEELKLNRIKNAMTYAAKHKQLYHLWWHPHNFGSHTNENFLFLEKILKHYVQLHKQYNFSSITMSGLAKAFENCPCSHHHR
ncbi:polysaccharide deacetylase family protein [Pedobacter immunditicola]|uniref:polysaccharide deacetylase family protein n=1 Tax=Pedobacter immunditicola TaxID=3133440 RepID=UPI0030B7590F